MPEPHNGRVAVYLDFDNIVLSWYDRVHGRNSFSRDRQKIAEDPTQPGIAERLAAARIDVGAIIDYASSFGTLVLTRAYADWSAPINAEYRSQLVARAIDLVQLFPAAAYAKNGADIRLAVDAVEDMFRLDDLTHVVIVGGDSDYVPLAQRCKRLGRYVVGIGVAGSTAKSLTAACDEFASYDSLPGISLPDLPKRQASGRGGRGAGSSKVAGANSAGASGTESSGTESSGTESSGTESSGAESNGTGVGGAEPNGALSAQEQAAASAAGDNANDGSANGAAEAGDAAAPQAGAKRSPSRNSRRRRSSQGVAGAAAGNESAAHESAAPGNAAGGGAGAGPTGTGTGTGTGSADAASTDADEAVPTQQMDGQRASGRSAAERKASERTRTERNSDVNAMEHDGAEDPELPDDPHQASPAEAHHDALDDFDLWSDDEDDDGEDTEFAMTGLLIRALLIGQEKDDTGWLHTSAVKQQMRRMDPSFNEKALGFRSFSDFLKSRSEVAETEESGHERLVRLRDQAR